MAETHNDNWDEHWDRYASAASRNPAQQMRHRRIETLLRERTDRAGAARVLDLGSGQGDLLVRLRQSMPEAELAGFELSESGVAISRRKVPTARLLAVDLFQPEAAPEAAGFAGWATDAVCSEVLEHVDDPTAFLREAGRYLAPGARLVVTVPGGPMSAFDRHIGHRRHFDRAAIAEILTGAGYAVERVERAGFPFFNLYRGVVIARGEQLAVDVEQGEPGMAARVADAVMAMFRGLFRLNLTDAPGGWQIVAIARWPGVDQSPR